MQPSNALTPYPVLSSFSDGYEGVSFDAEINADLSFGGLQLSVEFSLDDQALLGLIQERKAAYAVHIECPSISFREVDQVYISQYVKALSQDRLNDCVEICTFVVACEELKGFRSDSFAPDYDGLSFDIGVGGILAIGPSVKIDIDDEASLARKESIIRVVKAPGQTLGMRVNTDQPDCVLVSLSAEVYDAYFRLGGGRDQDIVLSLVMLPAMQVILSRLIEGEGEDKAWAQVIEGVLEKNGVRLDDIDQLDGENSVLSIAQKMLDQPLMKAMLQMSQRVGD